MSSLLRKSNSLNFNAAKIIDINLLNQLWARNSLNHTLTFTAYQISRKEAHLPQFVKLINIREFVLNTNLNYIRRWL